MPMFNAAGSALGSARSGSGPWERGRLGRIVRSSMPMFNAAGSALGSARSG
jgi:hypothetical protein